MRAVRDFISGRRTAWVTLIGCLVAIGLTFGLAPQPDTSSAPATGLPSSAQSAQVTALLKKFPSASTAVGIVVWSRTDDAKLSTADRAAVAARAEALAAKSVTPEAVHPTFSKNGKAALVAVPVKSSAVSASAENVAITLRTAARHDLPSGMTAKVTGEVGFTADIVNSFAGADFRLLIITAAIVALLLIITYRSPLLWIVPLVVIGAADGIARLVVGDVGAALGITVSAQTSGILSVLVFGAGTDYALLLVARYRDELHRTPDRHEAMSAALKGAGPAVIASAITVTLSLLTLLLASLAGNRALGFACAIGIVTALAFTLIMLPAALVIFGRGLFWPFAPKVDPTAADAQAGVWARIGRGIRHRPAPVAIIAALGVGALALGLVGAGVGLTQTQQLLGNPESVQAQAVLDHDFGTGYGNEAILLVPTALAGETSTVAPTTLAMSLPAVTSVTRGETHGGRAELLVALNADPQSAKAFSTIRELRASLARTGGDTAKSLVGGPDATALDEATAAQNDQNLILPIIVAIVFVMLLLLLRSLVAPILLLATVLLTFFGSLGVSNLIFRNLLGFPAFADTVVLFGFLFLVALGVDYNIFLVTRAREERLTHGTRDGMLRALASTGGVITSAGIVLASVFVVLSVLPVVALTQVGVIVCVGVLLDTLVVRTLLVPALVFLLGDKFFWPGRGVDGATARERLPRDTSPAR